MDKLEYAKNICKTFINLDIHETELSPVLIQHPFFSSAIIHYNGGMFNALEDKEKFAEYKECFFEKQIKTAESLSELLIKINKPFRLTFISFLEGALSKKECGNLLGDTWEHIEFISNDVNVKKSKILSWLNNADKTSLMNGKELKIYERFDDVITVYRGCNNDKAIKGISWTLSKDMAKWFSERWGSENAILLQAKINKQNVIAYLENEYEILLNYNKLYDIVRL